MELYVHLPFCRQKCRYCDFVSFPGMESRMEAYADALLRENMQKSADYINTFFLKRYDLTVTQEQFDAMIAMNYALGPAWMNAANRLPGYIISGIGNYTDQQIASAFAAWCHVGGKVNTVALQRRIMEEAEWKLLIEALSLYCQGRLSHHGNRVLIAEEKK